MVKKLIATPADKLLCAPGALHELETCLIDGRLQRVYKNLWPSLREFWLWASQQYSDATYVVFEQQRLTFRDMFQRSVQAAGMYCAIYGIQKGWSVYLYPFLYLTS
jgi:hypothetical protein